MTHGELVARNKANAIDGLDRAHILAAFDYREDAKKYNWQTMGHYRASLRWRFIGNIAIRKSDGFTVTREQVEDTEIPT